MQAHKINDSISTFFMQKESYTYNAARIKYSAGNFTDGISSIDIKPIFSNETLSYIGLILLSCMLIISAIWYFSPNSIKSTIRSLTNNPLKRSWESSSNTSGMILDLFFYLNFIFVLNTILILIYNKSLPDYYKFEVGNKTLFYLIIISISYIIFRQIFVFLTGFIFDNIEMGKIHNKLLNSLEKTLGLIILPILLFYIYSNSSWLLVFGSLILLVFVLSRWVFTMALGLRITKFSWFHIILYLCALEIIPFLMIIKLMKNQFFQV
ncbi:MAG: hypothetical protein C0598_14410 [Marinilabiliales bacterium]|nr:MAG: hypothetical protein C0598_14410 [Marinilabiliales bacterium]